MEFENTEPTASPQTNEFDTGDFVNSYISTWRGVVLQPREFFGGMPTTAGYGPPILFGIVAFAVSGLLGGLLSSSGSAVAGLIFAPIAFVIGSFIGAAILHVSSLIFADRAQGGFQATWRVTAYSSGVVAWVTWIPLIGFLLGLYQIYLLIMGVEQVHKTTTGKAAVAVLVPVLILFVVGVIVAVAIAALVAGLVGGAFSSQF